MLKFVTVKSIAQHPTALVVFLHGLGDSGHGWAPVGEMLKQLLPHAHFIFPNAPVSPVTVNFGMSMPSWYDIVAFNGINDESKQDRAGLLKSVADVHELIHSVCKEKNISPNRVVLGGFSQGGAIALLTAATAPNDTPYAGIVGLSTYLPLHNSVKDIFKPVNINVPIFMGHGTSDPVVQYDWGVQSHAELEKLGFKNVQFHSYKGMEHSSCDPEIRDLGDFLRKALP